MFFDPIFAVPFFLYGLALGSFLNVCIYRLPREMSVVRPGSACPLCRAHIAWYDNLPVVSWLVLRGRCRACKGRISPRYLLVELLTGLLFVACYAGFGWTLSTFKFCAFAFLLLGLIFTDAEHKLLPDTLTLPGLAIGLGFSLLVPVQDLGSRLLTAWIKLPLWSDFSWRLLSLVDSGLGAAVGASFIYGAGAIYRRARGVEGMGFGDVKLMGMVGAFLGIQLTIFTLFAASLVGSIFGRGSGAGGVVETHPPAHRAPARTSGRGAQTRLEVGDDGLSPLRDAVRGLPGKHGPGGGLLRQQAHWLVLGVLPMNTPAPDERDHDRPGGGHPGRGGGAHRRRPAAAAQAGGLAPVRYLLVSHVESRPMSPLNQGNIAVTVPRDYAGKREKCIFCCISGMGLP